MLNVLGKQKIDFGCRKSHETEKSSLALGYTSCQENACPRWGGDSYLAYVGFAVELAPDARSCDFVAHRVVIISLAT